MRGGVPAAVGWSIWLLPLLLLPIIAVHKAAGLSIERERQALHVALTGLPNRSTSTTSTRSTTPSATMSATESSPRSRGGCGAPYARGTPWRPGGDEFAIVAPVADTAEMVGLAERMTRALDNPFTVHGVRLDI